MVRTRRPVPARAGSPAAPARHVRGRGAPHGAGSRGAHLRLRDHAVRRHPHGPRGDLRRVRPRAAGVARRRTRRALRAERHRRRRPAAGARARDRRRLDGARRPRDPAVPRGHDRAAGPAAEALHRRGRVDPVGDRPTSEAAGRGRGLRGRRRPLLLGARRRALRLDREPVRRARCSRSSPSAAATPTARASEHPLDCLLWHARAARGAGLGQPVRARPSRLAHRVQRHRARPPRRADRRPGRRQRPRVPAPRDGRGGGAGGHGHLAVRPPLHARRDGPARRREDEQVARQPRLRLAPARGGRRPGGHPARAPRAPLPQRLGLDRHRPRRGRHPSRGLARRRRSTGRTGRRAGPRGRAPPPRRRPRRARRPRGRRPLGRADPAALRRPGRRARGRRRPRRRDRRRPARRETSPRHRSPLRDDQGT